MKFTAMAFTAALMIINVSVWASGTHDPNDHAKQAETTKKDEQSVFGIPGDPQKVSRTINVEMSDMMKFMSGDLKIKKGETIRFVVDNTKNKVKHEMMINTIDEIKEHAEYMKKFPNMDHAEENVVSVPPGKTGEIVWNFNTTGEFYYACLVPGHMEAGMINKIAVN